MNTQIRTIFNQILEIVPKYSFNTLVGQHQGDRYVKVFTCWQQFMTMLFAQATQKDSLRDLELWLLLHSNKRYHLWIKSSARNTVSNANNKRPYQIYESLFYDLLKKCINFDYKSNFRFKNELYSLDASIIDLCLNIHPWAQFRKAKWAIKLHVLLNNKSTIPEFVSITEWKVHEINKAREATKNLLKWSIVAFDRWYVDMNWYRELNENGLFFVVRLKKNQDYTVEKKFETKGKWVISDSSWFIRNTKWENVYGWDLRLVTYYDKVNDKIYKFLTNNFKLSSKTIADIYKNRWQIELFFKWIKQNLKIKSFLWTSKNAIMTQIWIAMIYYLILSYIKYKTKINLSLLEFTRIIKELFMTRMSLIDALWIPFQKIGTCKNRDWPVQIPLF
jgi:hypothetical protein